MENTPGVFGNQAIPSNRRAWTLAIAATAAVAVSIALSGRLIAIQVVGHESYVNQRDGQSSAMIPVTPERGRILDRNGREIAVSRNRVKSLFAVPERVAGAESLSHKLSPILRANPEEIRRHLGNTDKKFVWLKRMLSEQEAAAVRDLDASGLGFRDEPRRFYPLGKLAAHLVGFVGIDHSGLEGAESAFEGILAGKPGFTSYLKDAHRRLIAHPEFKNSDPENGSDVWLTLDSSLQHVVEEEMDAAMDKWDPVSAVAIMMDTESGQILSWVVRPTFDPNRFSDSPQETRRNRAITDPFEPGSIFKPLTLALAYEAKVVSPTDVFECNFGAATFRDGRRKRTLHDYHPYGKLTAEEILVKSSNIGTTRIALRLGDQRMIEGIARFGVGRKTGIDVKGECEGWVAPKGWSFYSRTSVPWGHEVAMTPLQILCAINAIANGGHYVQPTIFLRATAQDGSVAIPVSPPKARKVVCPDAAALTARAMVRVVEEGTGKKARLEKYTVAGKTGTTCLREKDGTYSATKSVTSFVCFAPAGRPRVALLVSLFEPRKGAPARQLTGGACSAPAAARILERTFEHLGVLPDRPEPGKK